MMRSCPQCGTAGRANQKFVVAARNAAETLEFTALREYWRGFRSDSTFFSYIRCRSCHLVYCANYFSNDQLQELYAFMPDNTMGENLKLLKMTQKGYLRQIAPDGFSGSRVLEVGADIGLLADAIRAQDRTVVVDAIEPNRGVHEALQSAIGSTGSIAPSWNELPTETRYDLIVGVHVLDHLVDLTSALEEVVSRIRPGGHIYFVTHNERSLMRRLLGRRWPPFCLQHPHLFDHRTLGSVFEDLGFTDVRVRRTTNYFSLRHIARVATQLIGISPKLSSVVPALSLPLKLGNISVQAKWPG